MTPELLRQFLENKVVAVRAKMESIKAQDKMEIYSQLSDELVDTQISIAQLNKAQEDIHYYTNFEVKEKLKGYLLEEVPDLALYFKTDTINKVLAAAVDKAFERVAEEHFKGKLVSIAAQ